MPQQTATLTVTITIRSPLSVVVPSLPPADVGAPYGPVQFQAQGGVAPYAWSAAGLPPGLALSADGILSGTPAAAGTFAATITVTDAGAP